jgi:hypothetical protein
MTQKKIEQFVDDNNNRQCHEFLDNLTPADVFTGRVREILSEREDTKRSTMMRRRVENLVSCYETISILSTEMVRCISTTYTRHVLIGKIN